MACGVTEWLVVLLNGLWCHWVACGVADKKLVHHSVSQELVDIDEFASATDRPRPSMSVCMCMSVSVHVCMSVSMYVCLCISVCLCVSVVSRTWRIT